MDTQNPNQPNDGLQDDDAGGGHAAPQGTGQDDGGHAAPQVGHAAPQQNPNQKK